MAKKVIETKKSTCPVTKEKFLEVAKPISIKIGDQLLSGSVKEFASGSFGFYAGEKVTMEVDGVPVKFQLSLSLVAVGSKPA